MLLLLLPLLLHLLLQLLLRLCLLLQQLLLHLHSLVLLPLLPLHLSVLLELLLLVLLLLRLLVLSLLVLSLACVRGVDPRHNIAAVHALCGVAVLPRGRGRVYASNWEHSGAATSSNANVAHAIASRITWPSRTRPPSGVCESLVARRHTREANHPDAVRLLLHRQALDLVVFMTLGWLLLVVVVVAVWRL